MPRWCRGLAYKPVNGATCAMQIACDTGSNPVRGAMGMVVMLKEVDISKHKAVPKHVILNDKETGELLQQYNITLNQLPRILTSDPMVQKLGAKVGDVIKITRDSSIAGSISYYRVVVKGEFI